MNTVGLPYIGRSRTRSILLFFFYAQWAKNRVRYTAMYFCMYIFQASTVLVYDACTL